MDIKIDDALSHHHRISTVTMHISVASIPLPIWNPTNMNEHILLLQALPKATFGTQCLEVTTKTQMTPFLLQKLCGIWSLHLYPSTNMLLGVAPPRRNKSSHLLKQEGKAEKSPTKISTVTFWRSPSPPFRHWMPGIFHRTICSQTLIKELGLSQGKFFVEVFWGGEVPGKPAKMLGKYILHILKGIMCDIFIWRCVEGESCKPPVSLTYVYKIHVYNYISCKYIYICIQKGIIVFQPDTSRNYSRKWAEYGVIHHGSPLVKV